MCEIGGKMSRSILDVSNNEPLSIGRVMTTQTPRWGVTWVWWRFGLESLWVTADCGFSRDENKGQDSPGGHEPSPGVENNGLAPC